VALSFLGYNVLSGGSCFSVASDLIVGDALLGPLADNGGPTLTHVPLAFSRAIDAASAAQCPATDQRAVPRPRGAGCDVGSVEREPWTDAGRGRRQRGRQMEEDTVMNILDQLLGNDAASAVEQVGRQFGLDQSTASSALGALLPALLAGFHQRASSPSGIDALEAALRGGGHQSYLDNLQSLGRPDTVDMGNDILGQIFGSKDVSREVARRASAQAGIGTDILKRMLPVVAAMAAGAIARQQLGGASTRAGMVPAPGAQPQGGGLLDMLTPMLDANRDGTMIDDVIGMIGKAMSGR
jgi:uncharacterized protein YidB (DUF937 family)